ncbi:hypothetical protein ABV89_27835 [Priestia aryabhattai]|nr:hypothetical protein VL11_02135 [Priestia aryabhattai]KMN91408.1 hypothetical protein ABV89_27835 [Priestia aryabhattai]
MIVALIFFIECLKMLLINKRSIFFNVKYFLIFTMKEKYIDVVFYVLKKDINYSLVPSNVAYCVKPNTVRIKY